MAERFVFTRPEHRSPTGESQGPGEPVNRRFLVPEASRCRPVGISFDAVRHALTGPPREGCPEDGLLYAASANWSSLSPPHTQNEPARALPPDLPAAYIVTRA